MLCHYGTIHLAIAYSPIYVYRHENIGDVTARHSAHVGERAPSLFLCVLHIWDNRGPALGWPPPPEMLHPQQQGPGDSHQPVLQLPDQLVPLPRRHIREGVHLLSGGELGDAQVQQAAKLCRGRRSRMPREVGYRFPYFIFN